MAKRLLVVINVFVFILIGIFTVILLSGKNVQIVEAQSCGTPGTPSNVLVSFPNCVGDTCNFTQASCSWGSVSGATQYNLVVTEVESGTVVTNQQVSASTTSYVFSVTQNKTYKCDVSAVNSCGGTGTAGSYSLFCEVDALVDTTPVPTSPTTVQCGYPCTSTAGCQSGLVCAIGSNGQGYCAIPTYQSTCQSSPSISACCSAPTVPVKPTIPPSGVVSDTILIGLSGLAIFAVGILFFVL